MGGTVSRIIVRAFGRLFPYVGRNEYSSDEAVSRVATGIPGFIYDWYAAGLDS